MQRSNASMLMGASSWKDQFLEAFTVQAGKTRRILKVTSCQVTQCRTRPVQSERSEPVPPAFIPYVSVIQHITVLIFPVIGEGECKEL